MADSTRSERTKQLRKERRRRLTLWFTINTSLLAAIGLVILIGLRLDAWDLPSAPIDKAAENTQAETIVEDVPIVEVKETLSKGEAYKPPGSSTAGTEKKVSLTFVGDLIHAGRVADVVAKQGHDYPYTYVKDRFMNDDLTISNVETPITSRGTPAQDKTFVYKSSPKMAKALKDAGMDIVNLANNHILDQGQQGLIDTFEHLSKANVSYVGAGRNEEQAYKPVIVTRNGIRIAVLGFSRVIPEVSWYAGKNKPGVAATYDSTKAVKAIKQAAKQSDLVIVIAHWGVERQDKPIPYQRELARAYIDAGADLIIGGHPHVLQGFEQYKNKWIVYSLGNFIFTRATEPKTWETMMLQAECTATGACELQMKPYYTELGRAVPLTGAKGQALIKRVESISYHTRISSEGIITYQP
ncbi:CapA family protein [Paenibacillus sp. 1001270B_150601_E10]|uniref:CapA family protein n=1 Tax=Paenibacillus sp. 1001270B_150601_E10 TaxID=2787079 RepID=UPI001E4C6378|nr:CapA family protein [Paenibacillus sp. 1001270B_150601_E10]